MGIALENVSKYFENCQAVDRINLEIRSGSLVALLGPSGSGKSTLLRLISGLETLDRGRIWLAGVDASNCNVKDRKIGFVFQDGALFKHLTVRQNIAFGLEIQSSLPAQIQAKVEALLDLIQLTDLGDRYPSQLSGGQRQRVALARALAIDPSVLLLDEPFGSLDPQIHKDLRSWLRHLHDRSHVTTILVTHNRAEAIAIADLIVIMNKGRIEQVGTPAEIYDRPANQFVTNFINRVNILSSSSNLFQNNRPVITADLNQPTFDTLDIESSPQVFVQQIMTKSAPVDYSI